jgi:hypothetical protein
VKYRVRPIYLDLVSFLVAVAALASELAKRSGAPAWGRC